MLALNRHSSPSYLFQSPPFVFQAFIGSLSYPFCDKGEWAQRTRRFSRGWGNVTFSVFTFGRFGKRVMSVRQMRRSTLGNCVAGYIQSIYFMEI
ncbi:hypothetical protein CDAR_579521 [Caerostris darwini]|uniref:Uncharacterized protein n=1 Tax=Caerostris darwini TaxID=1538125 RepID=A0AAV4V2G0_9ARAC|nr:hypothetical protein CDAR_579521 [Caerostris darwini]